MLTRNNQKTHEYYAMAGSEVKPRRPVTVPEINTTDFLGLSWVLVDDDAFSKENIIGGKIN